MLVSLLASRQPVPGGRSTSPVVGESASSRAAARKAAARLAAEGIDADAAAQKGKSLPSAAEARAKKLLEAQAAAAAAALAARPENTFEVDPATGARRPLKEGWVRCTDDADVWYANESGEGEALWEPPWA